MTQHTRSDEKYRIPILSDQDIIIARTQARILLNDLHFSGARIAFIITSISELARNILRYAETGFIYIYELSGPNGVGVEIIAEDSGPGISDLDSALRDGFSTSNSLGLGLPGVKRLMDAFEIESTTEGTRVCAVTWSNTVR